MSDKPKETRLPARDGKTPSNYVQKRNGEVWYKPLPQKAPTAPPKQQPKAGS